MCERELRIKTTVHKEKKKKKLECFWLRTSERLVLEYKIADTYTTIPLMVLTETWNAMQCNAVKQVAQISTHDLAFNDIRKTSCCLQSSSYFNELTDITKQTHRFFLFYSCSQTCTHTHIQTLHNVILYLFNDWSSFFFAECIGPFDCAFDINTCNGQSIIKRKS